MILNNITNLITVCEEEDSAAKKWAKRALMGVGAASLGLFAAKSGMLGKNIQDITIKTPNILKAGKVGWYTGQQAYDVAQKGGGNFLDRIGSGIHGANQAMKLSNAGYNAAFKIRDNINPQLFNR